MALLFGGVARDLSCLREEVIVHTGDIERERKGERETDILG